MSMRISTSQIYDSAVRSMQRANSAVKHSQNQIAADRRILTPSDDPVASAQVLNVSQSKSVNEQYQTNQKNADSQLRLVESQLTSAIGVLQSVRTSLVQGGSVASMTNSDREAIAKQIESNLSELLGIANTDNGLGEYLFSGYQGGTLPFAVDGSGTITPPSTLSPIKYYGDDGDRALQVSASRQMAVTVSGASVFMDGRTGNGTFTTTTGGNGAGNNQGSGIIDSGSVLDPQKWTAAVNNAAAGLPLEIRFSNNAVTGALEYAIYDPVGGLEATAHPYTAGQAISLKTAGGVDFGSQVVISGTPAAGDTFDIAASTKQSVFQTMQNIIGVLRSPVGATTYTATQFSNDLAGQMSTLDQQLAKVTEVQTQVGANMKELDALTSTSSDLAVQYSATLSDLQDLDYYDTYSLYIRQQQTLEAAQKSFSSISGLSLFKYI
jgi:flagellar hook-associated protein 3 FlgL